MTGPPEDIIRQARLSSRLNTFKERRTNMAAPDKIYMPNELLSEEWQRHIEGEDTAYIRKDALLEWAKEHKRVIETHGDERDAYSRGEYSVLNTLIDKLKSM